MNLTSTAGLIYVTCLVFLIGWGIYRIGFIKTNFFDQYVMNLNEDAFLYRILTQKNSKLEELLKEMLDICKQRGFNDLNFTIRFVGRAVTSDRCGSIYHPLSRIFIYKNNTDKYSDDDLRMLIAHEAGHAMFRQYKKSHPILERISKITLDEEEIADAMSIYIYGKEMFLKSHAKGNFQSSLSRKIDKIEFTRPHLFVSATKEIQSVE